METEALKAAAQFGPDVFLIVFVLILAAGMLLFVMRMQSKERSEWRADMTSLQEEHREERKDWSEKQAKQADQVTTKLESILLEISRKTKAR